MIENSNKYIQRYAKNSLVRVRRIDGVEQRIPTYYLNISIYYYYYYARGLSRENKMAAENRVV